MLELSQGFKCFTTEVLIQDGILGTLSLVLPVQAVAWACDHSHTDLQELQPQLQLHVRPFLQSSNQERGRR